MAGDVDGGGHAWVAYRPINYPLNWAFLDWCYWIDLKGMDNRSLFFVNKKAITGSYMSGGVPTAVMSKYKSLWFAFNEDVSHPSLILDVDLVR
jgi:hypothetical protein